MLCTVCCGMSRALAPALVEHAAKCCLPAPGLPERTLGQSYERRAVLSSAAAVLLSRPTAALGEGPQQVDDFTLRLPSRAWKVKTEVQQAIRVRREKVFEASEPGIKASLVVTRAPLGAERSESEVRESLMDLAGAFQKRREKDLSKEEIVKIITRAFDDPAARRERQWMSVTRLPDISEYQDVNGQRYVRFGYDAEECTGQVASFTRYDGAVLDDCDGRVLPQRRHFLTAIVIPTKYTSMRSNYLDGSNGQRSRFLESLWLLDASAPVSVVEKGLCGDLPKIADSFQVTPPVFQEE